MADDSGYGLRHLLKGARWLILHDGLSGLVLSGAVGVMAAIAGLLPLGLPWQVRLVISAIGAVLAGLALPPAWQWSRDITATPESEDLP